MQLFQVGDAMLVDLPENPPDRGFSVVLFGWVYDFQRADPQPLSSYCWYEVIAASRQEDSHAP